MLDKMLNHPLNKITLELTDRCNNNCKHCYIMTGGTGESCGTEHEGPLDFEKIQDILTEARILGAQGIHLTGGEPLLHKNFTQILTFAVHLGFYIEMTTNGILMTDQILSILEGHKEMVSIRVSLYGLTDETYDLVTETKGRLSRVYKTIEGLYERNIPYIAELITLPINERDLSLLEEIQNERPYLKELKFSLSLFLNKNNSKSKNDNIKKLRFSPEKRMELLTGLNPGEDKDLPRLLSLTKKLLKDSIFYCGAGYDSFAIDARGIVYPCLFLNHSRVMIDLKKQSLRDAVNEINTILENWKSESRAYQNRCGSCFLVPICERCAGTAWVENGKVDSYIDYFCESAHKVARKAGVLGENEMAWTVKNWKVRCDALIQPN